MTFWADAADDLGSILTDDDGPSLSVTHTPAGSGTSTVIPAIIVSDGIQNNDVDFRKIMAHAYFSRTDLATPAYQDTLTTESGEVWKLIRDAGSNGDLCRWEVERDVRSTFYSRQSRS